MKLSYTATLFFILCASTLLAQPANDECAGAILISNPNNYCSGIAQFTNASATTSAYGAASCFGGSNGKDLWFAFTAVGTDVTITVSGRKATDPGGTLERPEVALYTGSCGGTINEMRCASDSRNQRQGFVELYRGGLIVGATYYIRVQGRNAGAGTFQLCMNNYNPPVDPGSDCVTASILCDKSAFVVQKVTGAGNDNDEADNTCLDRDKNGTDTGPSEQSSTWFTWSAGTAGSLTFVITPLNSTDDIDFALFELPNGVDNCNGKRLLRCVATACEGPTGLNMTSTQNSEDINCDFGEDGFVRFIDMEAGKSYGLLINNFSNSGNGFKMEFGGTGTFLGPQADFTISEPDTTVCLGQPVTFTDASVFPLGSIEKWHWQFGVSASLAEADTRGAHTVSYTTPGLKSVVLTVTSDKGCVTTIVKTIRVECCADHFSVANGTVRNLSCPDADDGAIDLSITSNFAPYTFLWNDSTTTEDLSNLLPGTYTVTVTDQVTCDTTLTFSVTGPPPTNFDIQTVKPTCGGGRDGTITISVSGGTPPYQFNWQNQGFTTNNMLANLPRGDYSVTVRDSNSCDTILMISLRELELQLNPSVQAVTPPLCNGGSDGSIQVAITNGNGPFLYNWNDGRGFQSSNSLNGLRAGTYRVDVQDANLCVGGFDFVMEDHPPLQITFDSTNTSCNGVADGSATAIPSGGVGTYTFAWSNGQNKETIIDLPAGSYIVTVTDSNQCTLAATVVITEPEPVLIQLVEAIDVICNGDSTGVITVSGSGGTEPYEFSLDGSIFQNSGTFNQVKAGNYTITIADAGGCTNTTTAVINQPPPLIVDAGPDTTIDLGTSIDLQAIANAATVTWEWTPADRLSCTDCPNPTASPSNTTTYLITVSNQDDCDATDEITITVNKVRPVFIPNAFSPNDDGVNDRFTFFGGPAAEIITTLRVFDRWGNLLFEGSNLPLGQENAGWDGVFKGKPLGTGVYTYMAEVRFIDGEVILYEGDITIVR